MGEGAGEKSINAQAIVDPDKWSDDLVDRLTPLLQKIAQDHANRLARKLRDAGIIDQHTGSGRGYPEARSALGKLSGNPQNQTRMLYGHIEQMSNVIKQAAMDKVQKVADMVQQMDNDGASMQDIQKAVQREIGSRSNWRKNLAIHATTATIEGAKNAVLEQVGPLVTKTWTARKDNKVRPAHKAVNGQTVSGDSSFIVAGHPMRFPGDPLAPIELTVNCRCHMNIRKAPR